MGISWRNAPAELAKQLRRRGLDPERVTDVEGAWQAFREFLGQSFDGLETAPDSDADGFIVQWGRYSWNDGLPTLSFTRQFAVDVRESWAEEDWYQPEYWQLNLELVFPDAPELADLDQLNVQDTGFDFSPPGEDREHAFGEVEWEIRNYPTLRALWAGTPRRSGIELSAV